MEEPNTTEDWIFIAAIVLVVLGLMVVATIVSEKRGDQVKGIGGWLWIPIVGFVLSIGVHIYSLIITFSGDSLENVIAAFRVENDHPAALLRVPVLGSTIFSFCCITTALFCLFYIYKKSAKIIWGATFSYALALVSLSFDYWADGVISSVPPVTERDPALWQSLMRSIPIAIIWSIYFHISKRVRNTFVN
jgi:Protein of unknown function (DUF2569)